MTLLNTSSTPKQSGRWVVTKFGGPSVLEWNTDSPLQPTKGQALVRILIAGVSGADNIQRAGGYLRFPATRQPGFTPGYDLVGIVEEVNHGGDELEIVSHEAPPIRRGDYIATMSVTGSYATHILVPLVECITLRKTDDLLKASALPLNYMTALGMLTLSKFPVTDTTRSILIGSVAGGVGTALAQLTHSLYPQVKIFGTCSPSKFDWVQQTLNVTPIDRNTSPQNLPSLVRTLNHGNGVDIAYEATGHPEAMTAFLASTTQEQPIGKLIAIGFIANISADGSRSLQGADAFDPIAFCNTAPERMAFFSVTNDYWRGARGRFMSDFDDVLMKLVRSGELEPVVEGVYKLEDAVKINEMLATGKGVRGKMVMVVDEGLWEQYKGRE